MNLVHVVRPENVFHEFRLFLATAAVTLLLIVGEIPGIQPVLSRHG